MKLQNVLWWIEGGKKKKNLGIELPVTQLSTKQKNDHGPSNQQLSTENRKTWKEWNNAIN